ncbi:MAG: ATPase domain-containing protein [Planctomycetaceae bacterium]
MGESASGAAFPVPSTRLQTMRLQTGITELDKLLGGGLLPGTMTVVLGATGIGKTQLGLQFAQQGLEQERERGIIFDMTARGDAQSHDEYAARLYDWAMQVASPDGLPTTDAVWDRAQARRDSLHLFHQAGRRVSTADLTTEELQLWKAELNRKLQTAIGFFYGNFVHGVRRCVVDGVEPVDRASESFQFHLFEYIYHQILKKEAEWVARDFFRVQYRANEAQVREHAYDHRQLGCLMLCTTHEVMLDDLISRPIETGDLLSNANTILLMGKIRDGLKMGRALYVAKHRGSACEDTIVPYEITETGLRLLV